MFQFVNELQTAHFLTTRYNYILEREGNIYMSKLIIFV